MAANRKGGVLAYRAGLWVGGTVSFLAASLLMVQIRAKVFGGFPSGDWPRDGYTWHFLIAIVVALMVWVAVASLYRRLTGKSTSRCLSAVGMASAPMLGLVVTWSWYGLTGPQFHAPACTAYPVCHDSGPLLVLIWAAPWILWGLWSEYRLFREAVQR